MANSLAEFYRHVFGWRVGQMEAVDYWRIDTGSGKANTLNGGLTFRAPSDFSDWSFTSRFQHSTKPWR